MPTACNSEPHFSAVRGLGQALHHMVHAALSVVLPLIAAVALPMPGDATAQTARKPSYYDERRALMARPEPRPNSTPAAAPAVEAPAPTPPKPAPDPVRRPTGPASMPVLLDEAAFLSQARTYHAGTPMAVPHVIFVIDRSTLPPRIDYVDTPRFELHERFMRSRNIQPPIAGGAGAIDRNYTAPDRRFVFGTLSRQPHTGGYTYEFWEGDLITAELLVLVDRTVRATFFAPVQFKTNSTLHARRAREAAVPYVTQDALVAQQPYWALNAGSAIGRLRLVASTEQASRLAPQDIAVLQQVPISLPPVAGVITERASTVLSHVNLLARGWGIPNMYLRDATRLLRAYDGQWVVLQADNDDYHLRPATDAERSARELAIEAGPSRPARWLAAADIRRTALVPLAALRRTDASRCGAKAANLGSVRAARLSDVVVPDGFCIPFAQYARFMQQHDLASHLAQAEATPGFKSDPEVRRTALATLRETIAHWPADPAVVRQWQAAWQADAGGAGVFVRSSSNSEDLPRFSGAGLYSTVPNVVTADALSAAVRTVWSSIFNFEAYEARRMAGVAQDAVVMGVLVQRAINPDSAGVMVTRDPFDISRPYATYISAKRGIGIRVVEGERIAEQVLYSSWSKAVQVVSRSAETTALQLDRNGGVQQVDIDDRAVLTDDTVRRLAAVADRVKRLFNGVDQDIEWAIADGRVVVLQARPYLTPDANAPAEKFRTTPRSLQPTPVDAHVLSSFFSALNTFHTGLKRLSFHSISLTIGAHNE